MKGRSNGRKVGTKQGTVRERSGCREDTAPGEYNQKGEEGQWRSEGQSLGV